MSAFIDFFNLIRDQLFILLNACLGDFLSPQISVIADGILWFTWLWCLYHMIFKPFLAILSYLLSFVRNKLFKYIEEGERKK